MKPRLLFVDDSRQVLDGLARMLRTQEAQWDMTYIDDPGAAWELLLKETFDAAVLDVMMPGITGLELLERMRSLDRTAEIPVVMLTGLGDGNLKRRALDLGATDLLGKPIQCEDLIARLRSVLRIKAFQDQLQRQTAELEKTVRMRTAELYRSRLEAIWRLGKAAEHRDNDTGNHVIRVGCMSRAVAETLGMDRQFVETLFVASPLHDIGKIGIPDAILMKQGPLTDAERQVMQRHCWIGERILREDAQPARIFADLMRMPELDTVAPIQNPWLEVAASIALTHHEKWDGSGYPIGLCGAEIPLESRIIAVVDVFDALRSERPYKRAFSEERSLAIMEEGRGTHFAPEIYDAFLKTLPELREIRQQLNDDPVSRSREESENEPNLVR